jgi:hypothetical protein
MSARGGYLQGVLLACLLGLSLGSTEAEARFHVSGMRIFLLDEVYRLDARLDYAFSNPVLGALENGVPLTIELNIQVYRTREWWLDEWIASLTQRYRIEYYELSEQYLLTYLNSGVQQRYASLAAVTAALSEVHNLPVLDRSLLEPNEQYTVRMRARLDIEALPAPLRPIAYISPGWHLASEWYTTVLEE